MGCSEQTNESRIACTQQNARFSKQIEALNCFSGQKLQCMYIHSFARLPVCAAWPFGCRIQARRKAARATAVLRARTFSKERHDNRGCINDSSQQKGRKAESIDRSSTPLKDRRTHDTTGGPSRCLVPLNGRMYAVHIHTYTKRGGPRSVNGMRNSSHNACPHGSPCVPARVHR